MKLRTTNKNSPLEASDPHISFIGHTNKEELVQTLTEVDLSNGYANRILWCAANRAKLMPNAEFLDWKTHPEILSELKAVYDQYFANTDEPKRLYRSDEAQKLWTRLYTRLNDEKQILGFIDGVLVRDTSHLLKLALIYAVLDQSERIEVVHFNAAIAVCDFCQATARWLFGERTGDRLANQIFQALLRAHEGLTRLDIRTTFVIATHHAASLEMKPSPTKTNCSASFMDFLWIPERKKSAISASRDGRRISVRSISKKLRVDRLILMRNE